MGGPARPGGAAARSRPHTGRRRHPRRDFAASTCVLRACTVTTLPLPLELVLHQSLDRCIGFDARGSRRHHIWIRLMASPVAAFWVNQWNRDHHHPEATSRFRAFFQRHPLLEALAGT